MIDFSTRPTRSNRWLLCCVALLCGGCCAKGDSSQNQAPARQPAGQPAGQPTTRAVPPPAGPGKTERVRFKPGTTGAEIKGSVLRGERNRYLIGAAKGQSMTVSITSTEDNATFSILAPDGKTIPGTEEQRDLKKWTGTLPASGDTIISVGPTRGNATFSLDVNVAAAAKNGEAQCTGDMANSELPCTLKDGRSGWCKGGACKDICPPGHSYHPNDTRCHQRRDCKPGMGADGTPVKTAQCNECFGEYCFDAGATKDPR